MTALVNHEKAEKAWRKFIDALARGQRFEPGTSVPLDRECWRGWAALLAIAERLPKSIRKDCS